LNLAVGVIGAAGRMGATVCRAVEGAVDLDLVARVDRPETGLDGIELLGRSGASVAVDFTVPEAVVANAEWCAAHGINCVIGTTGIGAPELERLAGAYPPDGGCGCIVAPNFAIGAVLLMHFAALAAPWFDTAEIIELHHDGKADAPSGTALATAARMESASAEWAPDPTRVETLPGVRGGLITAAGAGRGAGAGGAGGGRGDGRGGEAAGGAGGVRIHSVRMRGMVAHQEVILGTTGQTLTLRHDSIDRESFMPGVLAAIRAVVSRPGLTVGLEAVLGL
jgi:4-hydroxy-tetrahydrodipicolinate reductase